MPTPPPTDSAIESQLRLSARRVFDEGRLDQLTVRRVRALAEAELGLPTNHLREDAQWKARSKTVIEEYCQQLYAGEERVGSELGQDVEDIPALPVPRRVMKATRVRRPKRDVRESQGSSRAQSVGLPSTDGTQASRRGTISNARLVDDEDLDDTPDATHTAAAIPNGDIVHPSDEKASADPFPQVRRREKEPPAKLTSFTSEASITPTSPKPQSNRGKRKRGSLTDLAETDEEDEATGSSSVASLPRSTKQAKTSKSKASHKKSISTSTLASTSRPATKHTASKALEKGAQDLTPAQHKIRTLQSQLAKCGVRKVWGSVLKRYDSDKEKVRYLEDMLREVGIVGRFNERQAKRIKMKRELAQELGDVQEGDVKWGMGDGESAGRGRRSRGGREGRVVRRKVVDEDEGEMGSLSEGEAGRGEKVDRDDESDE